MSSDSFQSYPNLFPIFLPFIPSLWPRFLPVVPNALPRKIDPNQGKNMKEGVLSVSTTNMLHGIHRKSSNKKRALAQDDADSVATVLSASFVHLFLSSF